MPVRRCVYCGVHTDFGRLSCRAHADLLKLDPYYASELRRATVDLGPTRITREELLTGPKRRAA